ncbi:MAG: ABC transporter ATP-binding protein [Candidatus Omnitrophota bacterium]|jgi:cobalt/nickel transport system ATP-binding protein
MDKIIFELKNVFFSHAGKFPALCNIDLTVNSADKIAILGANGTGKSTLLHLLDGLIFPQSGSIKAFGSPLNENSFDNGEFCREFRRKVGFVFQNPDVQLFCPTVEEDIFFGPLQLGIDMDEAEARFDKITEKLNIKHLIKRMPHQLSLGEKKKVSIASVLVIDPEVLLLDEPTAGLDPRTCRELIDLIDDYHAQGRTVITAIQDLHMVPEVADKIFILNEEKSIAVSGSCEEILTQQPLLERFNLAHVHKHKHDGSWHNHPHQHTQ